jgi:hypothetical protein
VPDEVLAVVQHHDQVLSAHRVGERVEPVGPRHLGDVQRGGHGVGDQLG